MGTGTIVARYHAAPHPIPSVLLLEAAPETTDLLAFVDEATRSIRESGGEPRFIIAGPVAYERLREAVAARFNRENQHVEQVQWLTVVVDPSREDRICVLPPPREADAVRIETI